MRNNIKRLLKVSNMSLPQDHYCNITFIAIVVAIEPESNAMTIRFKIERCTSLYNNEASHRKVKCIIVICVISNTSQCSRITYLKQISSLAYTAEKIEFSIADFFRKCDRMGRKLRIWSRLLKKSLTENFIFCAVIIKYCGLKLLFFSMIFAEKYPQVNIHLFKVSSRSTRKGCGIISKLTKKVSEQLYVLIMSSTRFRVIHTLQLSKCQGTPCSKQARYLKFK